MELKDAVSSEHRIYARWLKWSTRVALAALIFLYLVYALGVVEPFVPLEKLPRLWSLHADAYLAKPFDLDELLGKVSALTGGPDGHGQTAKKSA